MSGLSARDRRAAIVFFAVVMPLLILSRVLPAVLRWRRDERDAAEARIERARVAREAAMEIRHTRDSLAERRQRLTLLAAGALVGDTPALAAAALAEQLSDLAAETDVNLGAVQVQSDSLVRGPFVPVRGRASIAGDLECITALITRLERGPPLGAIRELAISHVGETPPNQNGMLHAEILVEAVARNPAFRHTNPRATAWVSPAGDVAPAVDYENALKRIIVGNLFRREREPAETEEIGQAAILSPVRPSVPPKPSLRLRGIVGGPPWDAILDGIPGRTAGAVVRIGDHVGGLAIVGLRRDTMIVAGYDTTWTLTIQRP